MITAKLKLAAAAAACVASTAIAFNLGARLERLQFLDRAELVRDARDAMLEAAAQSISEIEVKHVTIREKTSEIITERPVYRECVHDDDVMRLRNEARGYPDWQPPGSGELPGAATGE